MVRPLTAILFNPLPALAVRITTTVDSVSPYTSCDLYESGWVKIPANRMYVVFGHVMLLGFITIHKKEKVF